MSILSSTNTGKQAKITKEYLFEGLHLRLYNYAIEIDGGIWSINDAMKHQQQQIQLFQGLYTYPLVINGIICHKILKTHADADLIVKYMWAVYEKQGERVKKGYLKEILKLEDLW